MILVYRRKSFGTLLGATLVDIEHSVVRIRGEIINQARSVFVVIGHFLGSKLRLYG